MRFMLFQSVRELKADERIRDEKKDFFAAAIILWQRLVDVQRILKSKWSERCMYVQGSDEWI